MLAVKLIFWISIFLLFYTYIGYPVLLYLLSLLRKSEIITDENYHPTVSLIIAAYNEEVVIESKIKNSLNLDYPKDKLEIIVFSDASTDKTDEIVKSYENQGIKLIRIEGRKGKTFCQNEATKIAKGEIVVYSDANSMYKQDAIKKIIRNFADNTVGCVIGELQYQISNNEENKSVVGEGIYWQYEQFIKRIESKISSPAGGNGAIYAIRKSLFESLPPEAQEDFVRPLRVVQKGYRVIYESEAVAWENTTTESAKEFHRRVRMVTQAVYSLFKDKNLLKLLNPLKYGFFTLQLFSHKILRWFSGVFIFLLLLSSLLLTGRGRIYDLALIIQVSFFLFALCGAIYELRFNRHAPKLFHIAFYFCLSCYAMLKGLLKGLKGQTLIAWEPSR